jgi:zinc transport system ATP-binding protein
MPRRRKLTAIIERRHDTIVDLRDVTVDFGAARPALAGASLAVRPGEFVAIAGPNGGGKTTLLRTILGLQRATSGSIELFGTPIERLRERHRIGYLRQRSELGVQAPATVEEVVAAGRLARPGLRLGGLSREDRRIIAECIERVGLGGSNRKQVRRMSGGQQQRVFLAKLLAGEPQLLALDEPTTGVDARSQEAFSELLCDLVARSGVTILYVSHEFGAVEAHVDRLVMVNGGITFDGLPIHLPGRLHDPSHDHAQAHGAGLPGFRIPIPFAVTEDVS